MNFFGIFFSFYEILFSAFSYLILFLYGIDSLSYEMRKTFGQKLKGILSKISDNKWIGAVISAFVTALIQSSTATTIMIVSLVDSGLISFSQSLGLIAGANIGTTITAQLVSLNLMQYGSSFIVLGFLLSFLFPNLKLLGKPIFFFGLVLFSLSLLTHALEPIKDNPYLKELIASVDNPYIGVLIGILITLFLQSSSVTTGIVVVFGSKGILSLEQAIPIILGANIGTTITSVLASLKLSVFAKKTALAHVIFNFFGVLLFLPFLSSLIIITKSLGGSIAQQIANAHTIFNISSAIIFLLFSNKVEEIINSWMKSSSKELTYRTKYLNQNEKNVYMRIENVKMELTHLIQIILEEAKASFSLDNKRVKKLGNMIEFLNKEIVKYLYNTKEDKVIFKYIHISSELGLISDLLQKLDFHIRNANIKNEKVKRLIKKIFSKILNNISLLSKLILRYNTKDFRKISNNKRKIYEYIKQLYKLEPNISNILNIFETIAEKIYLISKICKKL